MELDQRRLRLQDLLTRVEDAPREWFNPVSQMLNGQPHHAHSVEAAPCHSWAECIGAWETAARMRQDLRDAMAVLLAVCASTQQGGNQLFVDLIGSPGSMKTVMCQGLLVSGHCVHVENMTKLVSGWKKPDDQTADCSFLARANNKTWVTCEFDVLGSSPEYQQLMGKMRRIFDGETSTTYGNDDQDRVYKGLRTPWIRAGTQKMMDRMADYDQSALGDRFLRFIISDPVEIERREIARSAMRSERLAMVDRTNGTTSSIADPLTRRAHALTGGYVDWLRANAEEKVSQVDIPAYAEDFCLDLAELCADLRARPNEDKRKIDTHDIKEMPTRLARQNMRLAAFLAVALNKFSVDTEVLRIVRKVALDTASGHSLKMVQWSCMPHKRGDGRNYQEHGGMFAGELGGWLSMPPERLQKYLSFLKNLGVLKMNSHKQMGNSWMLTERVYEIYQRIMRG